MRIIKTEWLTKAFGDRNVVEDISIEVNAGEIYGFLGLNGAGKTTTIRMLLGMIQPSNGTVQLFGEEIPTSQNVWSKVGYLVETPSAYPNLSVRENLEVYFCYRQLKDKKLLDSVIDKLYLTRYRDTKAIHLSLGNLQRLGLAKALMHEPQLLILDEPINGLDPAGIVEIRQLLQELAHQGATVFLSSHILSEIAKLATRIGIIHEGKLIKELSTRELGKELIKKLLIQTHDNVRAVQLLQENGCHAAINADNIIEIGNKEGMDSTESIATFLVNAQLPPRQLYTKEEDLESYFLRIIQKERSR